jgi:hypothetical protein
MVDYLNDILWTYLMNGDYFNFFTTALNTYFIFGIVFWFIGFVIFLIAELKTKNLGYAGGVSAVYFVILSYIPNLVTNAYSMFAMRYFGIILSLVCGLYIYRSIKG